MLDIRVLRHEPERVRWALEVKGVECDLDAILALDERRRQLLFEVEQQRARKNEISKTIGQRIGQAKKADPKVDVAAVRAEFDAELAALDAQIEGLGAEVQETEQQLDALMLWLPNIPVPDTPLGKSEEDNVEVRRWGEPRRFDFDPQPHWELGTKLAVLEFESATRMAGTRFVLTKGLGARMERALINFMLDVHTREHGYTEVCPPYIANAAALTGTTQLPKFEEDLFRLRERDYYLIPTAEVPLTNLHMGEILEAGALPLCYTAYTPCFRSEAGSAGRESRGMIRVHQFHKVELVKFALPEQAAEELQKLIGNAEVVLQRLGIPYRLMRLCTGDMTFAGEEGYDLEAWMPGMGKYVEISSCTRFGTFQARRCGTRYRSGKDGKPAFCHTMNGSGLACGRTFATILENYQRADGTVEIPRALRPYMSGAAEILGPLP